MKACDQVTHIFRARVPRQHSFAWPGPSPTTHLSRIYQLYMEYVYEIYESLGHKPSYFHDFSYMCHLTDDPYMCHLTDDPYMCHLTADPYMCHLTNDPYMCHLRTGPWTPRKFGANRPPGVPGGRRPTFWRVWGAEPPTINARGCGGGGSPPTLGGQATKKQKIF